MVPPRQARAFPSASALATWHEQFRQRLSEDIETGRPSLDAIARSLAVSRRTVQRRLADLGTTWRAELDSARRRRAQQAREAGTTGTKLARQLGYADPRSLRRALRRWDKGADQGSAARCEGAFEPVAGPGVRPVNRLPARRSSQR